VAPCPVSAGGCGRLAPAGCFSSRGGSAAPYHRVRDL